MLFLVFQLGDEGYALAADRIVEILPLLDLKSIRGAHPEIAGSVSYRGRYLPVVDLAQLELGRPAAARIGTRIIVAELSHEGRTALLGLILESATETLRCAPEAFRPFAEGPRGLVQRLDPDTLLPPRLRDALFAQAEMAR